MIAAVQAHEKYGTVPPGVDDPGAYRVRSGGVLVPFEMTLGPPDRAAAASVRWRPVRLGTRLFRHGDGRAYP